MRDRLRAYVPRIHYGLFSGSGDRDEGVARAVAEDGVLYFGAEQLFG